MMSYSEDHIALAAEYALGTLDADERALVETMMIVDPGFRDIVDAWDHKLAPLHQMVASVDAPAHLWGRIKAEIEVSGQQAPIVLPEDHEEEAAEVHSVPPPVRAAEPVRHSEPGRAPEPIVPRAEIARLSQRKRGGYAFGMVMSALAASFAAVVALQLYRPDLLPDQLRVKPKVKIVEVHAPAPPSPAQLVAVLQQDAADPAFILTVDLSTKTFTVRRVGAAPSLGKSFELWLVSDKLHGHPRSLGVIGASEFTSRQTLAAYDNDTINQAVYAVTVEPEGGSPTGNPTSNPIYGGKLVESVPAGDPGAH
jgi:anti-sigma-K factor RskA